MGQILKNLALATGQILTGFHPSPPASAGEQRFIGNQAMVGDFMRVAQDLVTSGEKNRARLEHLQQKELDFGNARG